MDADRPGKGVHSLVLADICGLKIGGVCLILHGYGIGVAQEGFLCEAGPVVGVMLLVLDWLFGFGMGICTI